MLYLGIQAWRLTQSSMVAQMTSLPRALFVSHGGGPMPLLGDPGHSQMVACLRGLSASFPQPSAIVVVSAHWEEAVPTMTAHRNPPLIYDYSGFPPESYTIEYPCPGDPDLAADIQHLLGQRQIAANLDATRGLDHGVFVPLKIMYPAADIPCVQMSLVNTLDAAVHINIGSALQKLAQQNVLVIGSGFSFHNMRAFFGPTTAETSHLNQAFEDWLNNTCSNKEIAEPERWQLLANWATAPGARFCHPREEHLLPLHVCYGVAQTASIQAHQLTILNKKASMYVW